MINSFFGPVHLALLLTSLVIYFAAICTFELGKKPGLSLFLLILATLVFKTFIITLDEFVYLWDEQFHALVAKNMADNILVPKLYPDPVLPYNYMAWYDNYIWLHKQPFFLMQMALFIKVLGAKAAVIRIPSLLCFTFSIFCIYKIGTNIATRRIGFIGAFLYSLNYFFSELLSGAQATDHNDIVFESYVIASVWAFTEKLKDPNAFKWTLCIALFTSFAVLTKWLPGFLVFGIWFFLLILKADFTRSAREEWNDLFKTFGLAAILPLAWQIYIHVKFPEESTFEQSLNMKHFSEPIEGHGGSFFFHIDSFSVTIGNYAPFFILLGVFLLRTYMPQKKLFTALMLIVTVVFLFFSIAATKMIAFPFIVYFVFFLGFAAILEYIYNFLKVGSNIFKKIIFVLIVFLCGYSCANIEELQHIHTKWRKEEFGPQNFRYHNIEWHRTCEQVQKELKGKYVVFNCDPIDYVKLMFYTDHIGYPQIPSDWEITLCKFKRYKVAVFDRGNLPQHILNNNQVLKIKKLRDRAISIDTVRIRTASGKFFKIADDGRVTLNDEGSRVIVTTFADGLTQLRNFNGKFGTTKVLKNGLLAFDVDLYEIYEQFILVRTKGNKFILRTNFDEDFVMPEGKTNFYASRNLNQGLEIEFVK
jgi:hypothetical protein